MLSADYAEADAVCSECFSALAAAVPGTMVIAFFGQRASHMPQPMHFAWSTLCTALASPEIAFTGHTLAHTSIPAHFSI